MNFFKHILILAILSCIFTGIIFVVDILFFTSDIDEEQYIEPTLPADFSEIADHKHHTHLLGTGSTTTEESTVKDETQSDIPNTELIEKFKQEAHIKKQQEKLIFSYFPKLLRAETKSYETQSREFLTATSFNEKIEVLQIEFYKSLIDSRGKMKNKTIKMFGVPDLSESEFLSVFVHEFAHYLDIYFFSRDAFGDTSKRFYDISWTSTTILEAGQTEKDFVSGYSMTNKYEDFGESFTYYILHNADFAQKAEKSDILKEKYEFFGKYLFFNGEFTTTDFSEGNVIRSYYWDITKIPINTNKFLQYIKNTI